MDKKIKKIARIRWTSIKERCKRDPKFYICEEWSDIQNFYNWFEKIYYKYADKKFKLYIKDGEFEYNENTMEVKVDLGHVSKICDNCGKIVVKRVKNIINNVNKIYFCNMNCWREYQKRTDPQKQNWYDTFNRRNTSHDLSCSTCDDPIRRTSLQIENSKTGEFFCSDECRRIWFSNVYSKSKENRDYRREVALKNLENGVFGRSDTEIQLAVNEILYNMNVEFINDKVFQMYSVDNYLPKYNLIIEVMGSFWHCDHRVYNEINYENQRNRIVRDKAKHSYFKNNHGIEILYLWEHDILDEYNNCKNMIYDYINKRNLRSYHSFNYNSDIIEVPYMEYDIKDIRKITSINKAK